MQNYSGIIILSFTTIFLSCKTRSTQSHAKTIDPGQPISEDRFDAVGAWTSKPEAVEGESGIICTAVSLSNGNVISPRICRVIEHDVKLIRAVEVTYSKPNAKSTVELADSIPQADDEVYLVGWKASEIGLKQMSSINKIASVVDGKIESIAISESMKAALFKSNEMSNVILSKDNKLLGFLLIEKSIKNLSILTVTKESFPDQFMDSSKNISCSMNCVGDVRKPPSTWKWRAPLTSCWSYNLACTSKDQNEIEKGQCTNPQETMMGTCR